MRFCRICGEKSVYKEAGVYKGAGFEYVNGVFTYEWKYACKNGHIGYSQMPDTDPEGTITVRTIASNGYQTSHIPVEYAYLADEFKDRNFHSVNIFMRPGI